MQPDQQVKVLARIWRGHTGWVFLPWIPAEKARDKEQRPFHWNESRAFHTTDLEAIKRHLRKHADDDVYFTPMVFDGDDQKTRRKAHAVLAATVLFADLDEADPRDIAPDKAPSIWWETSPGRYAGVWLMDSPRDGATLPGRENHRMSSHVGADLSGWDVTQLLRVPGSMNNKPGKGVRGGSAKGKADTYDWPTLMSGVPEVPVPKGMDADGIADPSSVDRAAVLDRSLPLLNSLVREYLRAPDAGGQDRSEVLWQIERELADAGCTVPEIVAVVQPTPWNKYAGRPDELHRLTTEAAKAGAITKHPEFWESSKMLAHIHTVATDIGRSPWALLMVVLARVVSKVAPVRVAAKGIDGRRGLSMNLAVAVLGDPGSGKGSILEAAESLVELPDEVLAQYNPGSGEAFANPFKEYRPRDPSAKKGDLPLPLQADYEAVYMGQSEISEVAARAASNDSRYMPTMLKVVMGESIGREIASGETNLVASHRYRYGIAIGVQPEAFGMFVDNTGLGFPQRFLFAYVREHGQKRNRDRTDYEPLVDIPDDPELSHPVFTPMGKPRPYSELRGMDYPRVIRDDFDDLDDAQAVGAVNKYDTHIRFIQMKVAAALAWMHGETDAVSIERWNQAQIVIEVSKRARGRALSDYYQSRGSAQTQAMHTRARGQRRAEDRAQADRIEAAAEKMWTAYNQEADGKAVSAGWFTNKLTADLRGYREDALELLVKGSADRPARLKKTDPRKARNGKVAVYYESKVTR
ncbi:hypothetical protein QSJ18_18585 [Gordonia sp. ABSL1-1]|uniref:hypothetical protein n=1 Tax=Gordonia sp. ABSL1-1 TaxID=3053923 RepID=UPI00257259BB|nr:hypothetical protein [Gordonia sp. ABSL1-1]MDL9938758.1 hypothetical protein [Gordonia sp. ABSL1-1]